MGKMRHSRDEKTGKRELNEKPGINSRDEKMKNCKSQST